MFRKLPSLKLTAKATENGRFEDEISSWVFLFSGAFWLVGFRECNVRSSDGFCSQKIPATRACVFFRDEIGKLLCKSWDIGPAIAKWKFFAMVLTWFNLKSQVDFQRICCTCIIWDSYLEPETSTLKWLFQLDDSKSLHEKWLFGVPGIYLSHRIHTTSIFTYT